MSHATCTACGARIVWAITPAGKRMPLDPARFYGDDNPAANVAGSTNGAGATKCKVLKAGERADVDGYQWRATTHLATCPKKPAAPTKKPAEFTGRLFVAGSVMGLRAFRVDRLGRLTGVTVQSVWTPGENVAVCESPDVKAGTKRAHQPATLTCKCGFYAFFNGDNAYADAAPGTFTGVVEGYGKVVTGTKGFRAGKARILALTQPQGDSYAPMVALVARNYPEVPMFKRVRKMLAAHPLTQPDLPTPETAADFWTRPA